MGLNAWNPASWEYTIHGFPSLLGKHGPAFGWWTPKASSDSKGTRLVYKTWEVQLCLPKARCLKSIFNLLKLHYHVAICSIKYMMSPQTIAQQESECWFSLLMDPYLHTEALSTLAGHFKRGRAPQNPPGQTQVWKDSTCDSGRAKVLKTHQSTLNCPYILLPAISKQCPKLPAPFKHKQLTRKAMPTLLWARWGRSGGREVTDHVFSHGAVFSGWFLRSWEILWGSKATSIRR